MQRPSMTNFGTTKCRRSRQSMRSRLGAAALLALGLLALGPRRVAFVSGPVAGAPGRRGPAPRPTVRASLGSINIVVDRPVRVVVERNYDDDDDAILHDQAAVMATDAAPDAAGAGTSASKDGADIGSSEWLPRALLFLFAVFCSTNFTSIKVLQSSHSQQVVTAVRFAVAALPFVPFIPKHMDSLSIKSGLEIGLWCAFAYTCQAIGLQHTAASKGAFICSLAMVVVPLLKSVSGSHVKPQLWAAVLLAVSGTALLVGVGGATGPNVGDLISGGSALGFGAMFFRMDCYAKQKGFDAVGCTVWQCITLAVAMAVWLLVSEGPQGATEGVLSLLSSDTSTLATLAWIGVVTTAGVLYVETWAMAKVDGAEAGVIFASEPVWATMFAALVLGESFGEKEVVGGICILLACLLTQLRFGEQKSEKLAVQAP
mmetsp:Transcript_20582/g.71187  ORF Transcript_20582/g.71187 Transcript_20582/m.71187 type:complete len:429 (+) Transcript_20582:99-1385(+)